MFGVTDPVQKQMMLLKMANLLEEIPDFAGTGTLPAQSAQRRWLSSAGALLKKFDPIHFGTKFDMNMRALPTHRYWVANEVQGQLSDAIETLKLELELDGRSDIGSVYEAGEVYKLFADLKNIISGTFKEIMVVDPYFNGEAFDDYLSTTRSGMTIKILAQKYIADVRTYADRHAQQYDTMIEIRKSNELHDRLIVVDGVDCWVIGGSIKDAAGRSPTYLLPLQPELARSKLAIYDDIWNRAAPVA